VDVTTLNPTQLADFRNRHVGFVFQFHHLLPEFTALENVMMPGLIHRLPRRECVQRAEHLLVRVGLKERLTHRPGELSGGEQQRVALAGPCCWRPGCSWATSPPATSTPRPAGRCTTCSSSSTASWG
jgi:lipoprotein-releasing system ATP-binding protein